MAFSQASTLGPRMKCCDSITSPIAASTSALMAAYCALRSSSGTFIFDCLLDIAVGPGARRQFGGQRSIVVEIEAAQDAGFCLAIAIAALRTLHHLVAVDPRQPVTVTTHPSDLTCRVADDEREVGHVPGHDCAGADEGISSDRRATDDGRVRADRAPALQPRGFVERVSIDLRPWVGHVGQHA